MLGSLRAPHLWRRMSTLGGSQSPGSKKALHLSFSPCDTGNDQGHSVSLGLKPPSRCRVEWGEVAFNKVRSS